MSNTGDSSLSIFLTFRNKSQKTMRMDFQPRIVRTRIQLLSWNLLRIVLSSLMVMVIETREKQFICVSHHSNDTHTSTSCVISNIFVLYAKLLNLADNRMHAHSDNPGTSPRIVMLNSVAKLPSTRNNSLFRNSIRMKLNFNFEISN